MGSGVEDAVLGPLRVLAPVFVHMRSERLVARRDLGLRERHVRLADSHAPDQFRDRIGLTALIPEPEGVLAGGRLYFEPAGGVAHRKVRCL